MLAEVEPDQMISGKWIIAVIGALATAASLVIGKAREKQAHERGLRDGRTKVEVEGSLHTKEHVELVTKGQLDEHLERIEGNFKEIKHSLDSERGVAREALRRTHERLDTVMDNQAVSRGELKQINLNVQRLLDRTDGKPPRRAGT